MKTSELARKTAEKMKELGWLHAFTEVGQVSNLIQSACETAYDQGYEDCRSKWKAESLAAPAERGTPITASEDIPPPCALCGRRPHPDSWGHSYRPRDENAIAPAERGEQT